MEKFGLLSRRQYEDRRLRATPLRYLRILIYTKAACNDISSLIFTTQWSYELCMRKNSSFQTTSLTLASNHFTYNGHYNNDIITSKMFYALSIGDTLHYKIITIIPALA